jgi:hypothetical protein
MPTNSCPACQNTPGWRYVKLGDYTAVEKCDHQERPQPVDRKAMSAGEERDDV